MEISGVEPIIPPPKDVFRLRHPDGSETMIGEEWGSIVDEYQRLATIGYSCVDQYGHCHGYYAPTPLDLDGE